MDCLCDHGLSIDFMLWIRAQHRVVHRNRWECERTESQRIWSPSHHIGLVHSIKIGDTQDALLMIGSYLTYSVKMRIHLKPICY